MLGLWLGKLQAVPESVQQEGGLVRQELESVQQELGLDLLQVDARSVGW